MPVKSSQSGERILTVLEKIAEYQPVGISELARLLDLDLSAVQRAVMTLARAGWICTAPGKPKRWELTARIHTVGHLARGGNDLLRRAHPMLQALRDETRETASLVLLKRGRLVVTEVLESRQYVRVVVPEGLVIPARGSATGRAILPYMSHERQIQLLGGPPDTTELEEFAESVARGYSVSSGVLYEGFTNIAAPVFEADGRPVGAVVVAIPSERLILEDCDKVGAKVAATARALSRSSMRPVSVSTERPMAISVRRK